MLDKRNQKLYKSLRGEYRRYARQLKATLLDCCKGKDEINETLGDVFSMLAEAQGAGRDFADVIPDPAASIRETALCFPARTMRRNTAFVLLLAGLAVLLCACGITIHLTSPIELDAVHDIDYDTEQRIASWEPVPHATEYQVYVNRKLYTTTTLNWTEIGRGTETDDTFYLQIVPVGSGRYQSPTKNAGAIIELDYPSVTLYFRDFDPWQDPHWCSWQGYYTAEQIHVTIVPTTTFYGRIQTDGDCVLLRAHEVLPSGERTPVEGEHLFRAECSYELTVATREEIDDGNANLFSLELYLYDFLEYAKTEHPVLPRGMMLFAADLSCDAENQRIYTVENAQFQVSSSPLYLGGWQESAWTYRVFPGVKYGDAASYNARYLLMRSTAETDTQFQMEETSAISASDEPQTVSLAKGWTLLRAEHSGALGQDEQITISADRTLRVGTLYYRNEHGAVPELTDQISFSADEAPLIDASAKSFPLRENQTLYIIVYAHEESELQLQRATQF